MTLYTIEVAGKPIMVFTAEDQREADEFSQDQAFCEDLLVLHHNGRPLWDGKGKLFVRDAHHE